MSELKPKKAGEAVLTDTLRELLDIIEGVAPDKPTLLAELGFPDTSEPDAATAGVARRGLEELLDHPQIAGFSYWSAFTDEGTPFNVELEPGSPAAQAFGDVITAHPDRFHSCVYLSDGRMLPSCENDARRNTANRSGRVILPGPVSMWCGLVRWRG